MEKRLYVPRAWSTGRDTHAQGKASGRDGNINGNQHSDGHRASWPTGETGVCVCVYERGCKWDIKTKRDVKECHINHCSLSVLFYVLTFYLLNLHLQRFLLPPTGF